MFNSIFSVVVLAISIVGVQGNAQLNCKSEGGNHTANSTYCMYHGMASIELFCDTDGMKIGFPVTELDAKFLPWKINNQCGSWNANSTNQIIDGKIWLGSNYSECGIKVYEEEDKIIFEQIIAIEYGHSSISDMIYRYFNDTYNVKCMLDKNETKSLQIEVQDRKTLQVETNKTAEFDFTFKVMKEDNTEVNGLVYIGEKLIFHLDLQTASTSVKSSPQNCYATKMDGSGKYNLITNKCKGEDSTVKINTLNSEEKKFSWEMLAFRYFGNSNGVKITCKISICSTVNKQSRPECLRCGQVKRKKREIDDDEEAVVTKYVTSPVIYIFQRQEEIKTSNHGESATTASDFMSKPEGLAIVVIIGLFMLVVCVVLIKKVFFSASLQTTAKAVEIGLENKGY